MFVFIAVQWGKLPDLIPGHYNAAGEVDRWGDKSEILVMPIVSAVMFVLLTAISYLPPLLNVPTKGGQKSWEGMYRHMRDMMILLKLEITALFFFIAYHVAMSQPLPVWFVPVFLVVVLGTTFFFVRRLVRASMADGSGAE